MRPVLVIAAAALAVALATWLSVASVHIVAWPDSGPQRVAVVGPLWQLAASLGVTGLISMTLLLAPSPTAAARRRRAASVAPLMALFLCALPYLPWLPDQVPLLLVLAGPVKWVVIAIALLAALSRAVGESQVVLHWRWTPRRRQLFVVSFLLYLAFGLRSLSTVGLRGDEPHYLIISHSLLVDGDLQIENNHRQRHYQAFTREELPPDYLRRGQDGEIYSIHAPGLPAFLLPAYWVGGAYGSLVMICLAGALTALAIFEWPRTSVVRRAP